MVGHTFKYDAAIQQRARDREKQRLYGDIYYVDAARLDIYAYFQPDINVLVRYRAAQTSRSCSTSSAWRPARSQCARQRQRPARHPRRPTSRVHFHDNVLAHLHLASWLDPCKVRRVTIIGSKKMVVCNDLSDGDEKIRIYDKGVDCHYEDTTSSTTSSSPIAMAISSAPTLPGASHWVPSAATSYRRSSKARRHAATRVTGCWSYACWRPPRPRSPTTAPRWRSTTSHRHRGLGVSVCRQCVS